MSSPDDLRAKVRVLANARVQADKTKAAVAAKETELWPQLKDLKHLAQVAKDNLAEAEAEVRALQEANPTWLVDGVALNVTKAVTYVNEMAVEWCIQHNLRHCLTLDVKAFEKLVKAYPCGIARQRDVLKAVISQDLKKFGYLEEGEGHERSTPTTGE
jgi:hypothetical protein